MALALGCGGGSGNDGAIDAQPPDAARIDAAFVDASQSVDASSDAGPLPTCARELITPLPEGTWSYEVVPGVVRADGAESFIVEVEPNESDVTEVRLVSTSPVVVPGGVDVTLVDDGTGGDRVAGDGVYTAGPFSVDAGAAPAIGNYRGDADSPDGFATLQVGTIEMDVSGEGSPRTFLVPPSLGLVRADVPAVTSAAGTVDSIVSDHLIELCGHARSTQTALRSLPNELSAFSQKIYAEVSDDYDFQLLFSTAHVELHDRAATENAATGRHVSVRSKVSGIGRSLSDDGATYGSANKLLALIVLDTLERGISSQNAVHELLHQWSAYMTIGGLASSGHWNERSSAGSLVGGFRWESQPGGGYLRDCSAGANQARRAAPLDRYAMGLILGEEVPDILIATTEEAVLCDVKPPEPYDTITVEDLQTDYGIPSPGPGSAQTDYRLLFVIEAPGRALSDTERTFYESFAAHFTADLPEAAPDPVVSKLGWATISRFFTGASFSSAL